MYAAKDGFSFRQIINSSVTKGHLKALKYTPPKSTTTVKNLIFEFYDNCFNEIKLSLQKILANFNKFSIT